MARHTTFRFCLDPTVEQTVALSRHAGAARFAFNQCLRLHLDARNQNRARDSRSNGAVDVGRGLAGWIDSRSGKRTGRPVGHPRFKKKTRTARSFRMRNKTTAGRASIRVGTVDRPRSVTLPRIGAIRVREDTRRLRRMIDKGRARILQATITRGARRWWISMTVETADLHPAVQHPPRPADDAAGWVGIDRGLHALVVAGTRDGTETLRVQPPKTLTIGLCKQRRLARAVSRKKRGSANRRKAAARLARHHTRVRVSRAHFLHQVSNRLVKSHDRLVLEDLNITGIMSNRRLARAVGDAAWGELARQITYKQHWCSGQVVVADRWFASSKTCSGCGTPRKDLTLKERAFECCGCGLVLDRDLNAAVNLAARAEGHACGEVRDGDRQAAGPVINACRRDGTGPDTRVSETSPDDAGTPVQTAPAA